MQFTSEAESYYFVLFFHSRDCLASLVCSLKGLRTSLRTSTMQGDELPHVEERGVKVQLSIGPMECLSTP